MIICNESGRRKAKEKLTQLAPLKTAASIEEFHIITESILDYDLREPMIKNHKTIIDLSTKTVNRVFKIKKASSYVEMEGIV